MKITERLRQLSTAVADQNWREFSMRAPAEPDRDADIVIMQAAMLIESRDADVVSLTNQRDYEYVRAENAEQERDELREQVKMLQSAIKNLRDVKGRHHSEIAYKRLIEALVTTEQKP